MGLSLSPLRLPLSLQSCSPCIVPQPSTSSPHVSISFLPRFRFFLFYFFSIYFLSSKALNHSSTATLNSRKLSPNFEFSFPWLQNLLLHLVTLPPLHTALHPLTPRHIPTPPHHLFHLTPFSRLPFHSLSSLRPPAPPLPPTSLGPLARFLAQSVDFSAVPNVPIHPLWKLHPPIPPKNSN